MSDQFFISYPHEGTDREWVRKFVESLQRRHAKVWFDELEFRPGESIVDAMDHALRRSDVIVSIITPQSVNRPNLWFEIGAALGAGKRMVAILPKDLDPAILPQPLRTRRFLIQGSPDETANELLAETAAAKHPNEKPT